ncbi:DUF5753 domain-containing protein [Streptomyces hokutonensis]|uniref:DUF5753 domain-containing protein n=1 Tax=Streptomyces hokutonensis TaxID=1306990 RepID=UPI0036A7E3F8
MKEDVEKARYPKKVRDLKKLEDEAVELGAYDSHQIHGLLQTPDHARELYAMRRPAYTEEEIDRHVTARVARKAVFERKPAPQLTFVQEEVTLRRPLGGRMVLPTDREDHAGMAGSIRLLKLRDGKALGHSESQLHSRLISDPKEVHVLEMRYGMTRAQALTPRESLTFRA